MGRHPQKSSGIWAPLACSSAIFACFLVVQNCCLSSSHHLWSPGSRVEKRRSICSSLSRRLSGSLKLFHFLAYLDARKAVVPPPPPCALGPLACHLLSPSWKISGFPVPSLPLSGLPPQARCRAHPSTEPSFFLVGDGFPEPWCPELPLGSPRLPCTPPVPSYATCFRAPQEPCPLILGYSLALCLSHFLELLLVGIQISGVVPDFLGVFLLLPTSSSFSALWEISSALSSASSIYIFTSAVIF